MKRSLNYVFGRRAFVTAAAALTFGSLISSDAMAQGKRYRFAYDQPKATGYGIAGDVFAAKLAELSKGTMAIDQYPGGQLGQEPQALQLLKSGDLDFGITSTANTATISPQAGVFSLHFLFRDDAHLIKALADPDVSKAVRTMIDETTQGVHALALATLGFRHIYSKKEIKSVDDMKGLKIRVQATATEDATFPVYGAQTVHMPFGSVYTSLQTGVVEAAENSVNVFLVNKHYEVAPVLSMTGHEANNSLIWVSDKLWVSLTPEQKGWVQAAADEVGKIEPGKALELEAQSQVKLAAIGVKLVKDVDRAGLMKASAPMLEKLSKDLGPHAEKIVKLVQAVK
jgi:TRAP-type transport system periplasmic protein